MSPTGPRFLASDQPLTLLTGASGYVGAHLRRRLELEGYRLRCMTRHPEKMARHASTEIVRGDVLDPAALEEAMAGVRVAYYLVHSMASTGDFVEEDRRAARNFARAARDAGVSRIIYLGGLGADAGLSDHLESRQEVGKILRQSGVETIEFQASIIIGPGSLSFEMVRALVDKLPIMVTPRWVRRKAQPIAIDDVVAYLVAALDYEVDGSTVFEIGGATRATYQEIMDAYARIRGLRRWTIPVPVLTPRLSSFWLRLVTPAYAVVGRKLVESLRNDTVATSEKALRAFRVRPLDLESAIGQSLLVEDGEFRNRYWSGDLASRTEDETHTVRQVGRRIVDSRSLHVPVSCREAFEPIRRIGGSEGWYAANALWRLRGWLDSLVGGPGLRRGRDHPRRLRVGDNIDFWRIEAIDEDRRLRLCAEMRLPGRAWLQFEAVPFRAGTRLFMTAEFDPSGVLGLAYWYALSPIHSWIFSRMLRRIGERASKSPDADERVGELTIPGSR